MKKLPYNQNLVDGLDFRGTIRRGHYLPALQRYDGRFYKELGAASDRAPMAHRIKHHLLIVSGLYGLLTPTEMIQCYSCHVPDHPDIADQWRSGTGVDLLTSLIVAYIKKLGIVKVFDFMAVDDYRKLISWEMIRYATGNNVLHCYSKQFAGADLLPTLGGLARSFLTETSESDLMRVQSEHAIRTANDEVSFLPFPMPEPPLAREISEQAAITSMNDKIGRMRRNIVRFLDKAVTLPKGSEYHARVYKLKSRGNKQDTKAAGLMAAFGKYRNEVEYDGLTLTDDQWRSICDTYSGIVVWAQSRGYYQKAKLIEEVDY